MEETTVAGTNPGEAAADARLANPIFCYRAMLTSSAGIWIGDNPLHFSFPLLLYQIIVIFVVSNLTHHVLCRFSQPLVISQILSGILLGPQMLGRNPRLEKMFFTRQSVEQLNTVSVFSLMIFYFALGVKADLGMIAKVGKKAVIIALLGTLLPFLCMYLVAKAIMPSEYAHSPEFFALDNTWCLSSYVVQSAVLSELNLLTSKVGRLAISASLMADLFHLAFNSCIGTYLLLRDKQIDPLKGFSGTVSFLGLLATMLFVLRPLMLWLIRRTPEGALLSEAGFVAVLLTALGCGLLCFYIGTDPMAGIMVFGLLLPGGAPLGTTLAERAERFVAGLLMPVTLALAGMKTNLNSLAEVRPWGLHEMLIVVSVVTKFVGCILPCLFSSMSHRDSVALGLMMVTKGIYEVRHAVSWKDRKIVDDDIYAMLIVSTIVFGGGSASLVKYIYRPQDLFVARKRRTLQHAVPGDELRILTCVYEQDNVNPMLTLLEATGPSLQSPICAYVLHLIQLIGRANAILLPHKCDKKFSSSDHIVNAFRLFEKQHLDGITVLPYVCIAPYNTMHEDVCSLALDKKVTLVMIPFHKHVTIDDTITVASPALQAVNLNILRYAPCSVCILVDKGLSNGATLLNGAAVYFLGGADDREALAYGARMVERGAIGLTVVRFLPPRELRLEGREELVDERVLAKFRHERVDGKRVEYREEEVKNGEGMVAVIRETCRDFSLLIVGRREGKESPLTEGMSMWNEFPELGVIGDLLASMDFSGQASTLVVQQQVRVAETEQAVDSPVSTPTAKLVVLQDEDEF